MHRVDLYRVIRFDQVSERRHIAMPMPTDEIAARFPSDLVAADDGFGRLM